MLIISPSVVFSQSNISIHGFVSQGHIKGFDNSYLASESEDGISEFIEMAINLMVQPSDQLRIGIGGRI